jgi:hypothetical protein
MTTSISSFLKTKLIAWVPFDELPGLKFKLAYLSREELTKIRDAATRKSYNHRTKNTEEEFDLKLFTSLFIDQAVLGWEGLTLEKATNLVPIEVPEGIDINTEIEYSREEAKLFFSNSTALELWLHSIVSDLETFRNCAERPDRGTAS